MQSRHYKCTEFILTPFYNTPPIFGSFLPVLTSPDTEMAPKTTPRAQNVASPFLHQDIVQSDHKTTDAQPPASCKTYQKFSQIRQLLHGAVGAPSWQLLQEPGYHRNLSCYANHTWKLRSQRSK